MPATQTAWLLQIEAVNFDAVLFDVDDLSAVRGGGDAMLNAPTCILTAIKTAFGDKAVVDEVYNAASHFVARIKTNSLDPVAFGKSLNSILAQFDPVDAAKALNSSDQVKDLSQVLMPHLIPQLTFAWGLVREEEGLQALERAVRLSQMRRLSVDIPVFETHGAKANNRPCRDDPLRPRNVCGIMPDGKEQDLSFSMALRRALGRTGRRWQFYERILMDAEGGPGERILAGFAHEFGELVEKPPKVVPQQIQGKLALILFDANRMGALRKEVGKSPDDVRAFAQSVKSMRARFLRDLLNWATTQEFMLLREPGRKELDKKPRTLPVLRMEMLMWGADEFAFVCPAWAVEPMLAKVEELLAAERWTLKGGQTITHSAGLVIANYKAPIRLLTSLADDLSTNAKGDRKANSLQYWATGGIDMPTRELTTEREVLFGIKSGGNQAESFTLPLDQISAGFELLRTIKGVSGKKNLGIPRNKLIRIAEAPHSTESLRIAIQAQLDRGDYQNYEGKPITADDIMNNACFKTTGESVNAQMLIRHLLELWHYAGLKLISQNEPNIADEDEAA